MAYDPNLAYNARVAAAQQEADKAYQNQVMQQLQQLQSQGGMNSNSLLGLSQLIHGAQPQQQNPAVAGLLSGFDGKGTPLTQGMITGLLNGGGAIQQMFGSNPLLSSLHAAPVNIPHIQTAVQPTGSLIGTFNDPSQNLQGFNNPAANLQGFNNPAMNYQGANNPALNMTGGSAVAAPKQSIQTGISMGK